VPHEVALITTIAAALGVALVLGLVAVQLKLPALVGYLIAGVLIGPGTPGFVADVALSQQLAEIGVMLLMFGVGLHFSVDDLLAVRKIALPGALVQIGVATALGAFVALAWGWQVGGALVFGLSLSVASTVVLLRALEARGAVESMDGRIAVGWLVVEDLAMVLVLVLLPAFSPWLGGDASAAPEHPLAVAIAITLGQVALFVAFMLVIGKRIFPWLLWQVARTGSRELFTLCVIAAAVGIAYGSAKLFGVSFALGAFFAGMVLRESEFSHRAADESLPLRDAFSVLFFVSVGMLFDPHMLIDEPLRVLGVVAIIVIGKTVAAFAIVLAFRYPLRTALTVSASLAQIGEFSFILAGLGVGLHLMPAEGQSLLLAGALISIALNPMLFGLVEPAASWHGRHPRAAAPLKRARDPLAELPEAVAPGRLAGHVIVVGYGRVGERVSVALAEAGVPHAVIEQNRELVARLRDRDIPAVFGSATDVAVLAKAHVAAARTLVLAIPDAFDARKAIEAARTIAPRLKIVAHAQSDEEAALLRKESATEVLMGEHELALGMTRRVLEQLEKKKS
jgi:CPA2 family monovalent cation:H+ antiporter-2